MRHGVRSVRGRAQQDFIFPWRGYFLWVGAALLLILVVLGGSTPRTAFSELSRAEVKFPPIRIHSDAKGPEAVVIDTSQAIPPAVSNHGLAALEATTVPSFKSAAPFDQPVSSTPRQAIGDSSPAAGAPAPSEAFAQLVHPDRSMSSKKAARTRRSARARIEAPRKYAEHFRHLACDWCGRSSLGEAF